MNAEVGHYVYTMLATDPDTSSSNNIRYTITSLSNVNVANDDGSEAPDDSFIIGETNGSVYTNTLMRPYEDHMFDMSVRAFDPGDRYTNTKLFVSYLERLLLQGTSKAVRS